MEGFVLSTKANARTISEETRAKMQAGRKPKDYYYDFFVTSTGSFKATPDFMTKHGLDTDNELNYAFVGDKAYLAIVKEGAGVSLTKPKDNGGKKSSVFTSNVLEGFLVKAGIYTPEIEVKENKKGEPKEVAVRKEFTTVLADFEVSDENVISVLEIRVAEKPAESEEETVTNTVETLTGTVETETQFESVEAEQSEEEFEEED